MCFSEPLGVKKNVATNLCVKQPLVSVDLFEQPSKQMFLVCSVVLLACFKRVFLKHLMHHKHSCDSRSFCCVVAIWFQEIVSSFLFGRNFLMVARFRSASATLKGQDALVQPIWTITVSHFATAVVISFVLGVLATFFWLLWD